MGELIAEGIHQSTGKKITESCTQVAMPSYREPRKENKIKGKQSQYFMAISAELTPLDKGWLESSGG